MEVGSRFTPRERAPGTQCIGGWVDPEVGMDAVMRKNPNRYREASLMKFYQDGQPQWRDDKESSTSPVKHFHEKCNVY
jgi:hypothetical protein